MDLLISDNDKICKSYDSMSYVVVMVGGDQKKGYVKALRMELWFEYKLAEK